MTLPAAPDVLAPDGSDMAHFLLPAGQVSRAVRHRTVEEIWYVLSGEGEMWRSGSEPVTRLAPGVCLTIPVGTAFQFRTFGDQPLAAMAVTMPPWPNESEAEFVAGPWLPAVPEAPLLSTMPPVLTTATGAAG